MGNGPARLVQDLLKRDGDPLKIGEKPLVLLAGQHRQQPISRHEYVTVVRGHAMLSVSVERRGHHPGECNRQGRHVTACGRTLPVAGAVVVPFADRVSFGTVPVPLCALPCNYQI